MPTSASPLTTARAFIEERPDQAFAAFALLHLALWTILPTAFYPNLPLDLIEALTYGPEWQLGYDKLPPLPWWTVEILHRVVGMDFAYYLAAQIAVLVAFALVWACSRPIVGATGALVSVLIIDGRHYFNFTAPKFNHDVIQLPFWALAGYAFHRALRGGKLLHWGLLGFAIGGAVWAKYFVVMLALPLALFVFIDRDARRTLATPGPYLAVAVAGLVASPHLAWLVENDFLPFKYAEARSAPVRGLFDHILHPVTFTFAQFGWLIPSLLIALPLVYPRADGEAAKTSARPDAADRRVVTLLAFGPAAALLAGSFLSGRGLITMWGYPLWLFLGLWIVTTVPTFTNRLREMRIIAAWGAVTTVYALAFIVQYAVLPHFDHRYRASVFPGDALATHIASGFRAATGQPLAYVIGSMWLGCNIWHYAPEHPHVLIDGKPARAPWINLADLRARGAIIVWSGGDRSQLPAEYAEFAGAVVQPAFTLPMRWGNGDMTFGWAILNPQK
jgi:4-amino-4-deoxy-L-arabinose transferase-like glycosyltransferase